VSAGKRAWTPEADAALLALHARIIGTERPTAALWLQIGQRLGGRTAAAVQKRYVDLRGPQTRPPAQPVDRHAKARAMLGAVADGRVRRGFAGQWVVTDDTGWSVVGSTVATIWRQQGWTSTEGGRMALTPAGREAMEVRDAG
jgi:hypothetical protein